MITCAQEKTDARHERLTFNAEASTPGKRATLGGSKGAAGPPSAPRVSSSESESESLGPTFVSAGQKPSGFRLKWRENQKTHRRAIAR